MTPEKFVATWAGSTLKERSASQSHFRDRYCFERGASKTAGGDGWADVWKRGHFGWEYKGKRKDLTAAYAQLQQYAVALENPPLLIVSDMDRIIIHTNWTNTVSETHTINLEDFADATKRDLLRWVFTDPERLKPSKTIDVLTREAADKFAGLAMSSTSEGTTPITWRASFTAWSFVCLQRTSTFCPGSCSPSFSTEPIDAPISLKVSSNPYLLP